MSGTASSFASATCCAANILANGHTYWGILEELELVGSGLIRVRVSGQEHLVDESLQGTLAGRHGQNIVICHVDGRWGAGEMPA